MTRLRTSTTEDAVDNPAAWHPDPAGKHDHRWWDGQRWTEHVADAGVASVDPLPAAPEVPETATSAATAPDATSPDATSPDAAASEAGPPDTGVPAGDDPGTATGDGPPAWGEQRPSSDQPAWGQQRPGSDQPVWGQQQPGSDQPVWGQQPSSQQTPWGGAPAATPDLGQRSSWDSAGGASGTNGLAVGALICGILSIPLLLAFGLGALLGIVALVLGIMALRRSKGAAASGRGMAIGGIVTGAISIVIGVFLLFFLFSFGFGIVDEMEACLQETGGDDAECQRRLEEELTDRFLGD